MLINQANLEAAYYNFNALFQSGFQRAAPWYGSVATEIPSTTRETRYNFFGMIPKFREWVGERLVRNLSNRVALIANKDFELTIGIPRNDFEDDQLGSWAPQINNIGYQAAKWPDDLMKTVIQAGVSTVCWDGQFFFDTDHPVDYDDSGAGTWSNHYTGRALSPVNYDFVRTAMATVKGEDGREMGIRPTHLIVPPQLETTGRQILQGDWLAPAAALGAGAANVQQNNPLKGTAGLIVIEELANEPTVWYLADLSKPIRPFIFQRRKSPVTIPLTAPTDANLFWRKEYIFGSDARGNAGYGLPHLIARSVA